MITVLTVVHVMACIVLILVVLLQRGKGAEIGAVFGGGASTTVFGSRGPGNFLTRITAGAVVVFFLTSLTLSYFATRDTGLFDEVEETVEDVVPEAAGGALEEVTPPAPDEDAPETGLREVAPPAPAEEAPAGDEPAPGP